MVYFLNLVSGTLSIIEIPSSVIGALGLLKGLDMSLDTEAIARKAFDNTNFTTYWLSGDGKPEATAALKEDINCDLLIVGAGFCGLWAALQAKEKNPDRHIVVIEGAEIANGATGRPAGILSTSVMHGIANTERMFPGEVGPLEDFGRENSDGFKETIEKYNIDCDLDWGGELTVAVGDAEMPSLQETHDLFVKYGHEAKMYNKDELKDEINSPIFDGGFMISKRSGTVHPGKLAWGLKRAILKLGIELYENTPLLKTKKIKGGVQVATPNAKISAKKVLLCTNAYAAGHKNIRKRVVGIRDRIVVTEPLTDEQLSRIGWKSRCGIYDTRVQLKYMRLTPDNRILFGGRLAYFFGDNTDPVADKSAESFVPLYQAFLRTFPQLAEVKVGYAWSGPIGLTTRMAVHYQSFHGGDMVYAGGYSGFGVTATRFGSRVGLDILDDLDTPERKFNFAKTQPGYVPPEPFRWLGFKFTMYALDTLEAKGGWRHLWVKMVKGMGFPITHN